MPTTIDRLSQLAEELIIAAAEAPHAGHAKYSKAMALFAIVRAKLDHAAFAGGLEVVDRLKDAATQLEAAHGSLERATNRLTKVTWFLAGATLLLVFVSLFELVRHVQGKGAP